LLPFCYFSCQQILVFIAKKTFSRDVRFVRWML